MNERGKALQVLGAIRGLPPEIGRRVLSGLPAGAIAAIRAEWWWQAHGAQVEPAATASGQPWRVWSIVAGRGFGKTRAGAEWVWARAREAPDARIALVAASLGEVAKVMVEGESGLLAVARPGETPRWTSSQGTLLFPSGARAFAYSAAAPGRLRGPQHHHAWCDELAKWPRGAAHGRSRADETWDNLLLGLRLGRRPRTIVTTTPKPNPLLRRVLASERSVTTHGRTADNPHLPADYLAAVTALYGGTGLGAQELDGLILGEAAGALWTRAMIDAGRSARIPAERLRRVVIGVDPPARADGDACGIVVCGLASDDMLYVLADASVAGLRPEGWARRVAGAAESWGASCVVAESNQGGDMVDSVLRGVEAELPVRLVHATRGKAARAEPVALRFETGRAHMAGRFAALEDELCALTHAGYELPGSPDRADAMVWAMTELMRPERPEPRVIGL